MDQMRGLFSGIGIFSSIIMANKVNEARKVNIQDYDKLNVAFLLAWHLFINIFINVQGERITEHWDFIFILCFHLFLLTKRTRTKNPTVEL